MAHEQLIDKLRHGAAAAAVGHVDRAALGVERSREAAIHHRHAATSGSGAAKRR